MLLLEAQGKALPLFLLHTTSVFPAPAPQAAMSWLLSSTQLQKQNITSPPKPSHPVPHAVATPTEDNHCPKTGCFGPVINAITVSSLLCPPRLLNIRLRQPPGDLESQFAFCYVLFPCGLMPSFIQSTAHAHHLRPRVVTDVIFIHVFGHTFTVSVGWGGSAGSRVWLCLVLVDTTATQFSEVLLLSDTPTGAVSEFWVAPVFANPCLFNISLSGECVLVSITL